MFLPIVIDGTWVDTWSSGNSMCPSSELSLYICICFIYDNNVMALPLVVPHLDSVPLSVSCMKQS